eukprot:TRINITY_DN109018_c0_g1_i1.p1 TRINITY_DN109018_c0_g1~~TRINITY_DN109018_c0_g1_i1.p1  ORF type:complete len:294 (-),score=57.39 TRINITY_DN109018_c0_g1_i1:423-1304(-)
MASGRGLAVLRPRRHLRSQAVGLALLGAAAFVGLIPGPVLTPSANTTEPVQQSSGGAVGDATFREALGDALSKIENLRVEVDRDRVISSYGKKAQDILKSFSDRAVSSPALVPAVDGHLEALFLRQLSLVHKQTIERFLGSRDADAALSRADKQFVSIAEALKRPDSKWDYEPVRSAMRAELEAALQQEAILSKEQERHAQTQRATAEVIGRIQKQMDSLGSKLRGTGAGSPWMMWTSYRLPGTPFQVSGRYTEGRTNIQLNLAQNKDPANAEAGLVEGLTPANLGLSLNLGL